MFVEYHIFNSTAFQKLVTFDRNMFATGLTKKMNYYMFYITLEVDLIFRLKLCIVCKILRMNNFTLNVFKVF